MVPGEIFADEIEAFLERLEAISAARVVANEDGDIERIYVTSESPRDDGTIRRAITSALLSQFNLHVDGWRIQIAHLEPPDEIAPIPDCYLVRLEESLTQAMTRILVELRHDHDGAQKVLTGTAQAPPGQAHRLRTVALAAVDAIRPLAERAGGRPALEALTLMPFAGRTVALAAVSLTSDRANLVRIGAEMVEGSESEAVVGAVLDALRKPVHPAMGQRTGPTDRRAQFEGLRRQYERLLGTEPAAAPPVRPIQGEASSALDTIDDLQEIRPEREGGAMTVMREEMRGESHPSAKPAPRPSVEDQFYRRLVLTGVPVHIRCRDGYEIPTAVVKDFGTYSLLVEANGLQELVFKHGIIAIRPYGPLPAEPLPPS